MSVHESVVKKKNIFSTNPRVDAHTLKPMVDSPCIDAGIKKYRSAFKTILKVHADYIKGKRPDIGAIEHGNK